MPTRLQAVFAGSTPHGASPAEMPVGGYKLPVLAVQNRETQSQALHQAKAVHGFCSPQESPILSEAFWPIHSAAKYYNSHHSRRRFCRVCSLIVCRRIPKRSALHAKPVAAIRASLFRCRRRYRIPMNSPVVWQFETQPEPHLDNRRCIVLGS